MMKLDPDFDLLSSCGYHNHFPDTVKMLDYIGLSINIELYLYWGLMRDGGKMRTARPRPSCFQPVKGEARKGRWEDTFSWCCFVVCSAILPFFPAKKVRERPIFVRYQKEDDKG